MNNNIFIKNMICKNTTTGESLCTMSLSEPVDKNNPHVLFDFVETFVVLDTEYKIKKPFSNDEYHTPIIIHKDSEGNCYHDKSSCEEELALYVSIENGKAYGTPMSLFLSNTESNKPLYQYATPSIKEDGQNIVVDKELDRTYILFGDGKLRLSCGKAIRGKEKHAVIGIVELDEALSVGQELDSIDKALYDPQAMLIFKNKEAVEVLENLLKQCKDVLDKKQER